MNQRAHRALQFIMPLIRYRVDKISPANDAAKILEGYSRSKAFAEAITLQSHLEALVTSKIENRDRLCRTCLHSRVKMIFLVAIQFYKISCTSNEILNLSITVNDMPKLH